MIIVFARISAVGNKKTAHWIISVDKNLKENILVHA